MYSMTWLCSALFLSFAFAAPNPQIITGTSATITSSATIQTNGAGTTITSIPLGTASIPNEPCATLSAYRNRAGSFSSQVPADVAYACLQSVPVNASQTVEWLESLKPFFQWQSTLDTSKKPPSTWPFAPVDVIGGLDAIIKNVSSYPSLYALDFDVWSLVRQTYDGHFSYVPLMVGGIALFYRPVTLVSVSRDGKDLPKPYVYADILLRNNVTSFTPSAVTMINGENATAYLEKVGLYTALLDRDAQYNANFVSLAQLAKGSSGLGGGLFAGNGAGRYFYAGRETVLTFENGTSRSYQNYASVTPTFANITSGLDVYNRYVNPARFSTTSTSTSTSSRITTSTSSTLRTSTSTTTRVTTSSTTRISTTATSTRTTTTSTYTRPPQVGYPTGVLRSSNDYIGGYYLQGAGYEDAAVLSVPSFSNQLSVQLREFQTVAINFLAQARAAGKTKLIIDLSANGGGAVAQGYDFFRILFPDIVPYDGARWRAHQGLYDIGSTISNYIAAFPRAINAFFNGEELAAYQYYLNENLQNFTSWTDYYGPAIVNGSNFTNIQRWNFALQSDSSFNVTGYGNRTSAVNAQRPFKSENMVILTDGYCASMCAHMVEMLRHQGGVKAVTVGGRAQSGAMQAVGGTKGGLVWRFSYIRSWARTVIASIPTVTTAQRLAFQAGVLGTYNTTLPFYRATGSDGAFNARDLYRQNNTQAPLEFVYEATDCRIFYKMEHVVDISTLWKNVVDVTWGSGQCVYGSVGLGKRGVKKTNHNHPVRREAASVSELARLSSAQYMETAHEPLTEFQMY